MDQDNILSLIAGVEKNIHEKLAEVEREAGKLTGEARRSCEEKIRITEERLRAEFVETLALHAGEIRKKAACIRAEGEALAEKVAMLADEKLERLIRDNLNRIRAGDTDDRQDVHG
jgi:vacuolar-type H+-ATPase subunit H